MEQYEFLFKLNNTEVLVAQYDEEKLIPLARIRMPTLGKEIGEHINYSITSVDLEEKLLGVLDLDVKDKVLALCQYVQSTTLETKLNLDGSVTFKTGKRAYRFEETEIKKYKKKYEELGLKKKGKILTTGKPKTDVEIYGREQEIWGKEQLVRIITSDKDFLKFLPFVMQEKIIQDIEGKKLVKLERGMPKIEIIVKKADHQNPDSKYVKFVRENFPPIILESAFPYQEQRKEQTKFWNYMQSGRRGVLVYGPTGNGKSTMILDYAFRNRKPIFSFTGNENTKMTDFNGMFVPADPKPIKAPSPLVLALIYDGIFLFEEIGPVPTDVLTGLNSLQDKQPFPVFTHFGIEYLNVGPGFRFVADGNLGPRYTKNKLTDPIIQRFIPIETVYPTKDRTREILKARAPKVENEHLDKVLDLLEAFRAEAEKNGIDVGLRGPVEVLNQIEEGALDRKLELGDLVFDNMISPLCIYDAHLKDRLIKTAEKQGINMAGEMI